MSLGTSAKNKQLVQNKEREQRSSLPSLLGPEQNTRATRRTTAAVAAIAEPIKQKEPTGKLSYEEARRHLTHNGLLPPAEPAGIKLLAKALDAMATNPMRKTPVNVQKTILALSIVASRIAPQCEGCKRAEKLSDLTVDSRQTLQIELLEINDKIEKLEQKICQKLTDQESLNKTVEKIEEATKNLDKAATAIEACTARIVNPASQQGNNTPSYRDALLHNLSDGPNRVLNRDTEGEIS